MVGLGHDKNFEGVDAGFEGFVFFREVLGALFEVGDVFGCFGEYGCLPESVSTEETHLKCDRKEAGRRKRGWEMRMNKYLTELICRRQAL
jgi:hypothetical protein